jgi:hypothetical protein
MLGTPAGCLLNRAFAARKTPAKRCGYNKNETVCGIYIAPLSGVNRDLVNSRARSKISLPAPQQGVMLRAAARLERRLLNKCYFAVRSLACGRRVKSRGWSGAGDAGNIEQTVVFTQDGDRLAGLFTGLHQSGTVEGTLDGTAIKFSVKGGGVFIKYTGDVTADTMRGTLISQGKNGSWTARRTKPE